MRKTFLLIVSVMLLFSGCESPEKRITKQSFVFDTVVSITADKKDSKYIDNALKMCNEYELIFSRTNEKSELYKINSSEKQGLSPHMKNVIEFSLDFSQKTDGAFDITVGESVKLWDVNHRTAPPSKEEISNAVKTVDWSKVHLEPFDKGDCVIDLGAVAKGYIADKLAEDFRGNGVENAIIDLGGNVVLIGEYSVGIRDPFAPNEVFATIKLKDTSAVTSGAYQRYFEYEGKRYHHIIDPRTGSPAASGVSSVTVISPSSMQADALSTAIFILGEDALSLCDEFSDTDALIITDNKEVITTNDFEKKYDLHIE